MATRRILPLANVPQNDEYDDEYFALVAALEWHGLSEEQRQAAESLAIYDLETYTDVRVGMRHRSAEEFIEWGVRVGVGVACTHNDLSVIVTAEVEAFRYAAHVLMATTGEDVVRAHIAQTRNVKVSSNIRSHKLPSGADFHFSPYDLGTPERTVWLMKCARRVLRPQVEYALSA